MSMADIFVEEDAIDSQVDETLTDQGQQGGCEQGCSSIFRTLL
jgi:hypothetical protein